MNRTGLLIALALAAGTGLAFGIFPQLDLAASRLFMSERTFPLGSDPILQWLRDASTVLIAVLAAPAFIAPLVKLAWPWRRMLMSGRAVVFIITTLVLGPALAVNVVLKDNSGRPRPINVVELGGSQPFRAWWDPRGACPNNCSFVAGEASGAFWTLAPAALAPAPWRPAAYAAALLFGSAVGLMRMSFGGHFLSDVLFAGAVTFLIIWGVHGLLYRRRTALTDEAVEHAIERAGFALRRMFGGRGPSERANPHQASRPLAPEQPLTPPARRPTQ